MKVYSSSGALINALLRFVLKKELEASFARIVSSSYYTLFLDGRVVDFGPERAPKGHARIKEFGLHVKKGQKLEISCLHYGFPSFDIMMQPFFFGIELYDGERLVASLDDFFWYKDRAHLKESCKYSFQRGLVERFDLSKSLVPICLSESPCPFMHEGLGQTCLYKEVHPALAEKGKFDGFAGIKKRNYLSNEKLAYLNKFDIDSLLEAIPAMGLFCYRYDLGEIKTGLLHLRLKSNKEGRKRVFVIFDETLVEGRFYFGRSSCNDFLEVNFEGPEGEIFTAVPYCLRHIALLSKDDGLDSEVSLVEIQNDRPFALPLSSLSPELASIDEAARNSFRQNSFDVFTDCPGRERAPWLCDSLFMGLAEQALFGSRDIERHFLENFLLTSEPHIPDGMLPMCFPSDHEDGTFIPEWALFYVLELCEYVSSKGDRPLADAAKAKLSGLLDYFADFENEYGLLENLDGWVFLEWSRAVESKRLEGVHFPTNMLYAECLCAIGSIYGDAKLSDKGRSLKGKISSFAFNGSYYVDNAVRKDGELCPQKDNVSEIGQYMAALFGVEKSSDFKKRLIENFPLGQGEEKGIARVAPFIGGYLRLFFLLSEHEFEKLRKEIASYFLGMARYGNTLWEKKSDDASLNHGFCASLCYILLKMSEALK